MTQCVIDSATIHTLAEITECNNPEKCSKWAWQSALTTTSSLIHMQKIKIAPSPSQESSASGGYGLLLRSISDLVGKIIPSNRCARIALEKTKSLVNQNTEYVMSAYYTLKNDENYPQWIQYHLEHNFIEFSSRLHGLFNIEFIPQIALITRMPEKEIVDTWKLSCDIEFLRSISKKQQDNCQISLIKDAFTLSSLLRGYYHDVLAKYSHLQIIHHPFRKSILPNLPADQLIFQESDTDVFLSTIILAGAISQRNQHNRIQTWIESITKARKGFYCGSIDLRDKEINSVALDIAINAAKSLGIRTSASWIDKLIDILISLGVTVFSTFILQGWEAMVLSATYSGLQSKGVGKSINTLVSNRENRLKALAYTQPGRIEHTWSTNKS